MQTSYIHSFCSPSKRKVPLPRTQGDERTSRQVGDLQGHLPHIILNVFFVGKPCRVPLHHHSKEMVRKVRLCGPFKNTQDSFIDFPVAPEWHGQNSRTFPQEQWKFQGEETLGVDEKTEQWTYAQGLAPRGRRQPGRSDGLCSLDRRLPLQCGDGA